jgi:nucleotide-binding universal stress UspA family protein
MPSSNTTLLLAVDDSPASERPLELVEGYRARAQQLQIVVLNVQARPIAMWPQAGIDPGAIDAALLACGGRIAGAAAQRLQAAGLRAEPAVRLGFPAQAIAAEAGSRAASLIVMGTRGHGILHGFALGSVAMRVAHGSHVPVCLVRPQAALPANPGHSVRVMLAVDGSASALRAATALCSWRAWLGELDVQMVWVQQPLTYLETVMPPHDDVIGQWSTRAGEEATAPARELLKKAGIRHHLHLTVGEPAPEIVHLAASTGCELLVLGTRGRGAAHHALIGSVALNAAAHASIPVILAS